MTSSQIVLAKAGPTAYLSLSDAELINLIFLEEDRLPIDFVRESVARGERLVPALAAVVREPSSWKREDAGLWAPLHACFALGAIGGPGAEAALIEAFPLAGEADFDWVNEEFPSIFGHLTSGVLAPLMEFARDRDFPWPIRHRAMQGMAALTLRNPKEGKDIFAVIAGIAADESENLDMRVWAGDVLLDFPQQEYRSLLLSLAESRGNGGVFNSEDVRKGFARQEPNLYWYQRDWLSFYSPEEIAARRERWETERLTEAEAWEDPQATMDEASFSQAGSVLQWGDRFPLAKEAASLLRQVLLEGHKNGPSLRDQYFLAMKVFESIGGDPVWFRRFDAFLEGELLEWLVPLPLDLAGDGLVDEAARLCRAWAEFGEAENFLGDLAVLLGEAGREAEARDQVRENLERFPEHIWVRIKAADALMALKDIQGAEALYRETWDMVETSYDRDGILERLIPLLEESGREKEAQALLSEKARLVSAEKALRSDGHLTQSTFVRVEPKIGRNDPCLCGSGKKYKKCCLGKNR